MTLKEFLEDRMRMSHIYQPVMIKTLLQNGGQADRREIARSILSYDQSQIEYYENVVSNMVGRVLTNHGIVNKEKHLYSLVDFESLSVESVQELMIICDHKIEEYLTKRGGAAFAHRRRNRRPVPGSVRYKVLKRAKHRCELCGVSAEERALEVDHITPKNLGGEDSINNYQALCYKCNANKGDRDDEDFRLLDETYKQKEDGCLFCSVNAEVVAENNLAVAFRDKFPITKMHTLIIPKRHCCDYFDLFQPEVNAVNELIHHVRSTLIREDNSIAGFNIGVNNGEAAGQTVFHCHLHLIPRRYGDVESPIGGVRNIVDGQGDYLART